MPKGGSKGLRFGSRSWLTTPMKKLLAYAIALSLLGTYVYLTLREQRAAAAPEFELGAAE